MSENPEPARNAEELAFIPPYYLLILSALGFLIAFGVALTQPEFHVVGWGGLGLGFLSLLAWALLAPEQLVAVLTGRTVRYGGTALVVTIVLLVALVAIYVVVREQNWLLDVSDTNIYALTDDGREVIELFAQDPTTPPLAIIGFYSINLAGQRDQIKVLLDDYVEASGGKITYEIVDPNRNPIVTEQYGARDGDIFVVPLDDKGNPVVDSAMAVSMTAGFSQETITNTIATASLQGDFRAYFLSIDGLTMDDTSGVSIAALNSALADILRWNTREVTMTELVSSDEFTLNDPDADGEVLVVTGGGKPLPDAATQVLVDYMEAGGDVIFFTDINVDGTDTLYSSGLLSTYLQDTFGVHVNNDIIFDEYAALQQPWTLLVSDIAPSEITVSIQDGASRLSALIFQFTHSITVADELPEGATVTVLARTSSQSYAKSGLDLSVEQDASRAESDPVGPFNVAVQAESTQTGSRVVIFGSMDFPSDQFQQMRQLGFGNYDATLNSLAWTTGYLDYQFDIPRLTREIPEQSPVIASDANVRMVNFAALALPGVILLLGVFVWFTNRERAA